MTFLLLSNDLLLGSQLLGITQQFDMQLESFRSPDELLEHLQSAAPAPTWIVADLTLAGLDAAAFARQLRDGGLQVHLAAVGPHVHADKLAAAQAAGFHVFTRGQLQQQLGPWLQGTEDRTLKNEQ